MKHKILFYIELPPPMHGMTYINQIIYDNLKDKDEYCFYDTNFTNDVNEVGKVSLNKVFKNISLMFEAWREFFKTRPTKIYTVLSATKYGIIRDFWINIPAILFNKKLVLHLHGFTYYKIYKTSKLYRFLFKIMTKNSQLIVLCEKQKKKTSLIMHKDSIVLYNCINKSFNNKVKHKNEILQVCYISNISKEKGTFDLINAIQNSTKDIKLVIAGNFLSYKDEFLELIEQYKNISYIGFANEKIKQELLESSDIFCLPSKLEEGSPVSIIEAMSYGLPILATDKGCIKDMIEDAGYLLKNDYLEQDIIDGLEYIYENYNKLSKISFDKYRENYSEDKFINNLENILKKEY